MSTPANLNKLPKRIQKEINRLSKDSPPGISIVVHSDNYRYFDIRIQGPEDTIYADKIYKLEMFLPKKYPMVPPKCRFITKIYHENVDVFGRICLDILKDKWSPALTITRLCLSIQLLMKNEMNNNKLNIPTDKGFKIYIKTQFNNHIITVFGLNSDSTMLDIEKKLEIKHGSSMSKSVLSSSSRAPIGIDETMWGTKKNIKLKYLGIKPNDTIIWRTIYTKYKSILSNTISNKINNNNLTSYQIKISLDKILNNDKNELLIFSQLLSKRGWCLIQFPKDIKKIIDNVCNNVYNAIKNKSDSNDQDEKEWNQLLDGYGYINFKDYKKVLRVLTGNLMEKYKDKYPKQIADDLENIANIIDKLIINILNIISINMFHCKHINQFNFKCKEKDCNITLLSGYKQNKNGVKCGLLDFVYYENLNNKKNQSQYPMIKDKSENVSPHTDPGLFSLSFLSTSIGLQLYDITHHCWREIENNSSVFWCGEAASKLSDGNILSGIHRVIFNDDNPRFTAWYECSIDNQLTEAVMQ